MDRALDRVAFNECDRQANGNVRPFVPDHDLVLLKLEDHVERVLDLSDRVEKATRELKRSLDRSFDPRSVACPVCMQGAQRACVSIAGRKKGEPMWNRGVRRFHKERREKARDDAGE